MALGSAIFRDLEEGLCGYIAHELHIVAVIDTHVPPLAFHVYVTVTLRIYQAVTQWCDMYSCYPTPSLY